MDRFTRRQFLAGAAAFAAAGSDTVVFAQGFPAKPLRIVIPFAPGGPTDTMTRLLAARLADELRQPVVSDNRPGVGGNIGAEVVARAPADGYTLLMGTSGTLAANIRLFKQLNYDPATAFEPVCMYVFQPNMLAVHPDVPAKTVAELIAWLKTQDKGVPYGSGGIGTSTHFAGEQFRVMSGTKLDHVAYKGDSPSIADAVAGNTRVIFCSVLAGVNWVRSGRLRVLGVTSAARVPLIAEVPPIADTLPGFNITSWYAVVAPAGTPKDVVRTLNAGLVKAIGHPELRSAIEGMGGILAPGTPEQLQAFVKAEIPRWTKLVDDLGIRM